MANLPLVCQRTKLEFIILAEEQLGMVAMTHGRSRLSVTDDFSFGKTL